MHPTLLLIIALLLAATVLGGMLYQSLGKRRDLRLYPPPGRMVRSADREFHVYETGEGPTVVLEAGIASTSLAWATVQPEIAREARVVSYDRSGFGWSARTQTPRTLDNAAQDLHTMLQAAALPPPYILVAHSYGGLIVRRFAYLHPELVAGMVLVDSVDTRDWCPLSDAQARRIAAGVKLSRRGAMLARLGIVRLALNLAMGGNRRVPRLIARWSAGKGASVTDRLTGEVRKLPERTWPMIRMHWSHEKCFATMAEYLALLPENARAACDLGWPEHIPIIVVTVPGATPELPANVEHRIAAKSGHWIQLDQPGLVTEAVRDVLARAHAAQAGR